MNITKEMKVNMIYHLHFYGAIEVEGSLGTFFAENVHGYYTVDGFIDFHESTDAIVYMIKNCGSFIEWRENITDDS